MSSIYQEVNNNKVTQADIAVFIPSWEEAANIALPAQRIADGLSTYYPGCNCVIVNCDNNSTDGTKEAFFNIDTKIPQIYVSTPPGVKGRGANIHNVLLKGAELGAKVIVLVDANITSIKPVWMQHLIEPIINGNAELVNPLYVRHHLDTPITRTFAYPMVRSIFGRRVMQPIRVERSFSGAVNQLFLEQGQWPNEDIGFAVDLQMMALATLNNVPICQAFMANPRVTSQHKIVDLSLADSFSQVAEAMFDLMIKYSEQWLKIKRSRPTILSGATLTPENLPPQVELDYTLNLCQFVKKSREKAKSIWKNIFDAPLCEKLYNLLDLHDLSHPDINIFINVEEWRNAIFNSAVFYKNNPDHRQDTLAALCPLIYAKIIATHALTRNMTEQQYNTFSETEAAVFDQGKESLIDDWKKS